MGISDRHYPPTSGNMRHVGPPSPFSLAASPVVKWLLIYNIGIYLVELIASGTSGAHIENLFTKRYGVFSVETAIHHGQIWRFITCQFLHADGHHLLVNMVGLFFFGRITEQWWGSRRFLMYYLLCGIAGPLLYTLLVYFPGFFPLTDIPRGMLGASAGVYALLAAITIIAPQGRVLLFFFLPMRVKTLAMFALGYAVIAVIFGLENAGGEAAHLGGALLGFLFMKKPQLLSWAAKNPNKNSRRVAQRKKIIQAQEVKRSKLKPRIEVDMNDTEIDKILDKVSREGIQSLTDKERKILNRKR